MVSAVTGITVACRAGKRCRPRSRRQYETEDPGDFRTIGISTYHRIYLFLCLECVRSRLFTSARSACLIRVEVGARTLKHESGKYHAATGGAIADSRSSGCGVRRSVRRHSAADFREDARGMQCEIRSESGRDQSLASGRLPLLGFAQSVRAAARLKAHERLSASFGQRAMPPSDRVVDQQERAPWRLLASYQAHFSEKIVYLLNSYQPKDSKRQSRASKTPRPAYSIDDARDIIDVFENAVRPGSGRHPVASVTWSRPRSAVHRDGVNHSPNDTSPPERPRSKGD